MANLDLKKTMKHLYAPSEKEASVVTAGPLPYLMIDGEGDPNTSAQYVEAVRALYVLAYAIRFACKAAGNVFTVMPLEGLWTLGRDPDVEFTLTSDDKAEFTWTLMILQPDFVTEAIVAEAVVATRKKKNPASLSEVRYEVHDEGEAAQIMHRGPYSAEGPTVAKLHQFIEDNGWALVGLHHEIYLSDPRKVAPERMKTVIRQPFAR